MFRGPPPKGEVEEHPHASVAAALWREGSEIYVAQILNTVVIGDTRIGLTPGHKVSKHS